jgi:PTS system nitrogen regulatory IIA component
MSQNINELRFDSILPDMRVTGRKQVFQNLATHVEKLIGTPANELICELENEEHQQSSAVGHGVSIPNTKLPRLTKPLVIFTRCSHPIDFKAADNLPVDLICLVLSPSHEGTTHLRRLAKVSRFFSNSRFCDLLRHAEDSDDIKSILSEANKQRLAA